MAARHAFLRSIVLACILAALGSCLTLFGAAIFMPILLGFGMASQPGVSQLAPSLAIGAVLLVIAVGLTLIGLSVLNFIDALRRRAAARSIRAEPHP